MESAVELAMETSKVESAARNQAKAKLNQLVHNRSDEPAGTRFEKLAGALDRRRRCVKLLLTNLLAVAFIIGYQQTKRSAKDDATSCGDSADGLIVDDVIGDVIQTQESADAI
ncbi:hypothetical protein F511_42052 [Dorcoceras hygrometricum]|uniref:Uncharacterized protein n=1 Tax=Dorcoceras hygrometricum TaxID=472368 RepID=A0A2Z7AGJ0_9LAMI|nr:hypothetical protein F511_42052 [Dorcoceras hygrometricum]